MRERTGSSLRAAVMTLIAGLLLPANVGFDVVVLRPLGLVATAVGAVLFVPAALLTAPNGRDGVDTALKFFIIEPAKSVFQRPLGDF